MRTHHNNTSDLRWKTCVENSNVTSHVTLDIQRRMNLTARHNTSHISHYRTEYEFFMIKKYDGKHTHFSHTLYLLFHFPFVTFSVPRRSLKFKRQYVTRRRWMT